MKKIMFNDKYGLTEAVLSGRKTMTRRIVPIGIYNQTDWKAVSEGNYEAVSDGEGYWHDIRLCGQYQIGEDVAVAQSYKTIYDTMDEKDGNSKANEWWCNMYARFGNPARTQGYYNKMFVAAEYMPKRIRITDIKVERLQDISEEDCLREGIYKHNALPDALGEDRYKFISYAYDATQDKHRKRKWFPTPREAFAALIDKVCKRGTWNSNPWVFAYEFELVNGNNASPTTTRPNIY